jgi:organic hydroperoxide reductase OsmC/OhrA
MTHEYRATVRWMRQDGEAFTDSRYNRAHLWAFDGGLEVPASAAPGNAPPSLSRADAVDPEEAFVAALSSCHMLFFLYFAAKDGLTIDRYEDDAVGVMAKNERGKLFVARVTLNPAIAFSGPKTPTSHEIADLHHRSHEECFIANSVRTEVTVAALPAHS